MIGAEHQIAGDFDGQNETERGIARDHTDHGTDKPEGSGPAFGPLPHDPSDWRKAGRVGHPLFERRAGRGVKAGRRDAGPC